MHEREKFMAVCLCVCVWMEGGEEVRGQWLMRGVGKKFAAECKVSSFFLVVLKGGLIDQFLGLSAPLPPLAPPPRLPIVSLSIFGAWHWSQV